MSVNGVTNSNASNYYQTENNVNSTNEKEEAVKNDVAAVYEPSKDQSKATFTPDLDKVKQLKMELSNKTQQMQSLVNTLFKNQGKKTYDIMDLLKGLKNGTVQVDDATAAAAQAEIGEDGYWGVEKTSDRLVEMAKALSGGDASKADELMAAMEKGFKEAEKAFGGKLPDICSQTIEAAKTKMNAWKESGK